jgi:tetratricopeptide (TPR) repeat protein
MRLQRGSAVVLVALFGGLLHASQQPGRVKYLEGLDAIENGQPAEAASAFTEAIGADSENADYYTLRGVAYLLSEQLDRARTDLQRSLRLRPEHRPTKMWLACAVAMAGEFDRDSMVFPVATRDLDETFLRQASREYGELSFRTRLGESRPEAAAMRAEARKKLAEGAARFARAAKSDPALAEALQARARGQAEQGRHADAVRDLEAALAAAPDDPDVLLGHARSVLALGDAATAREELTQALTARPDLAPAYLVRALAAARLGDARRARADLQTAVRLDAATAETARPEIEGAVAALPASVASYESLFAELEAAARAKRPWSELVDRALALHRVVNGRRLRCDESYQDRLRVLDEALRASPQDSDRSADLARFLVDESSVRRERVEPRAPWRLFRRQTRESQDRELERAEALADKALQLDPNNIRPLSAKAAVRMWYGHYAEAEKLLRRALELRPDDSEALELFAQVLEVASAQKTAQALDLRSARYLGSHDETVGDYIYTYTYWHDPSQEEKAQADILERESQALVNLSLEQIERAWKAHEGSAEGWYFKGVVHWRLGQLDEARAAYSQALRLDAGRVRWHYNLAGILAALGRGAESDEERLTAVNLVETSAAILLEQTWDHVARTRWKSARQALQRAVSLLPSDARVAAYLGIVNAADGRAEDAVADFMAALALEEARLGLSGRTLKTDDLAPLRPEDIGLSFGVRLRLGRLLLGLGRAEEALDVFLAGAALQSRLPREVYAAEVPSSMLPDPDLDPSVVPEADNPLALLAWSQVGAGEALNTLGRTDAAIEVLRPLETYASLLVNGVGAERLRRPELHAALQLARAFLAKGDLESAGRYAQKLPRKRLGAGPSLSPYAELEEDGTRLQTQISALRQERRGRGDEASDEWVPPDEEKVDAALRDIGPALGHPEMGDGMRRYAGDSREVELCMLVGEAVRAIVSPKSTRWRGEVVGAILRVRRDARSPKSELAARKLQELAVARGYPSDALAADLQAGRPSDRPEP